MGRTSLSPSATPNTLARRIGLPLLLLAAACANDRPRPLKPSEDLFDPNPSRRVQAVSEVRRTGGAEHVPALIEMLDDEDETVRLVAGAALTDLTGHRGPTPAYGSADERRRAVEAWRAWAKEHPLQPPRAGKAGP